MAILKIKNVGALQSVELDLKRVNVFIGAQASGKSTIAKIISQILWAEKNFLTTGDDKFDFYKGLISFHNFDRSYFVNSKEKKSEIVYESDFSKIMVKYVDGKLFPKTEFKKKEQKKDDILYQNVKVSYIPAERNFVSTIKNIQKYAETYNSSVAFLNDWISIKPQYKNRTHFSIDLPDLKLEYRYKENENRDILIDKTGVQIDLQCSSSGQQAILPLLLVAKEMLVDVYNNDKIFSPIELEHIKRVAPDFANILPLLSQIGRKSRTKKIDKEIEKLWQKLGYDGAYGLTHLIIEEPEQNLYPSTQRGLVEQLLFWAQNKHTLTLTTHSPFILYALDNCMLAGTIKDKEAEIEKLGLAGKTILPQEVGIWLVKEGKITSLQDDKEFLLKENLFDAEFRESHERMFQLLALKK